EVVSRCVNAGLKAWLFETAEAMIDELLDDSTLDKIVGNFSGKGVTQARIGTLLGRTRKSGWTKQDRRLLAGIWQAIEEGETTIDEAFPADAPPQSNGGNGTGSQPKGDAPSAGNTGAALADPKLS